MIIQKLKGRRNKGFHYICKCDICGKEFRRKACSVERAIAHTCSEKCRKSLSGKKHPNWGGEKRMTTGGYVYIYKADHPNANKQYLVLEHRLVMEKKIGRYLTKNEIVHHLNGIRNDNRPENLDITDSKSHEKFTYTKILQKEIKKLQKILKNNNIEY